MTHHYPNLDSASDWLNQISQAARPIRSTTQIWVVTRHQYGISALPSQTSFGKETSGSITKCRLFSRAKIKQKITFSLKGRQSAQVIQMSHETTVLYSILNYTALTRKIVFFPKIYLGVTITGLATAVEPFTTEQEVVGSIARVGLILRVIKVRTLSPPVSIRGCKNSSLNIYLVLLR